jgi:hypothetical protein
MVDVKVREDAMGECAERGAREHPGGLTRKQCGLDRRRCASLLDCEQISSPSGCSAAALRG